MTESYKIWHTDKDSLNFNCDFGVFNSIALAPPTARSCTRVYDNNF